MTILLDAPRLDPADRDDKAKLDRVRKFYAAVPEVVELHRLSADEALRESVAIAKQLRLEMPADALAELVAMLGGDMARLANELQKLSLYLGEGRAVTRRDLELLTPEARQSGMFELTDALAARDAERALALLDTLAKAGAYWPMQLALLAGLFRQALAVKEIGGRNAGPVQRRMEQAGLRVWPNRVRQLLEVAAKFSRAELERAIEALYETDRDLRRERPDDRILMETLVLRLTAVER